MKRKSDWDDKPAAELIADDPFRDISTTSTEATMPKSAHPIFDEPSVLAPSAADDPSLEGSTLKGSLMNVLQFNTTLHSEIDKLMIVAKELTLLRVRLQESLNQEDEQDQYVQSTAGSIHIMFTPKELIDGKIRELDKSMDRITDLRTSLYENIEHLREDCRLVCPQAPQVPPNWTKDLDPEQQPDPNFDPEALIKQMEADIQHPAPSNRLTVPTAAARSFLGPKWGGGGRD